MKKKLVIIMLGVFLLATALIGIAGSIGGIDTRVTEFEIESFSRTSEDTFCLKVKGFEVVEPCLTVDEITLDKSQLSVATVSLIKSKLEDIKQVNLINQARKEMVERSCVVDSDCGSLILSSQDETFYCVKKKCSKSFPLKEIEEALGNSVGVKK